MYITCLDLEGVLVPEIWIAFSEASGIPELKRTTRDEPDYEKLMNWRLGIYGRKSESPAGFIYKLICYEVNGDRIRAQQYFRLGKCAAGIEYCAPDKLSLFKTQNCEHMRSVQFGDCADFRRGHRRVGRRF